MQRPIGVSIPQGQNQAAEAQQTRGAPRQLLAIHELRTYAIQYTDDTGAVHVGLCHKMSGEPVYIHPNDEQWAGSIRTAANWLSKDVNARIDAHEALKSADAAPDKPQVDVVVPKET